ncbi:metalloregulator ArsR/SmtB family transcription factor [Candidatus Sororendozoicomonas aggregata]|uniref:ArsR/SmtB family transcription factor n=1 Tax=Candidatus Sororendozoicomonas aggregata TaxID=3073239 RepID=UPI002ED2792B
MVDLQIPCCSHLPELNEERHNRLAAIFRLLGDEGRLKMVLSCIDEPQPVTKLAEIASMSQPLASHHLKQLREARILKSARHGKQILYALSDYHIRHVLLDLATHVLEFEAEGKGEAIADQQGAEKKAGNA